MDLKFQILTLVRQIPSGRVTTYGSIGHFLKISPRYVGCCLKGNEDMSLPCHRVVKSGGVLADQFSLGNWPEQRRRLQQEGINFKGKQIIDFDKYFFDGFSQ